MSMIRATDLKNGKAFLYEGKPYQVIKYELIKMGRGGATVRVKVRNLLTEGVEEKAFSSNVSLDEVNTFKRQLQYLYKDKVTATFMDPKTFDQVEIPLLVVGTQAPFLNEGNLTTIFFWEERPISIELPPKVIATISETDPGVKGNSATNIYKSATLENGLKLKVPLFINEGDKILVDTRTGEYLERAK